MGREDYIHLKLRSHLKSLGHKLIAGQYPNGSDDELHILTIRISGHLPRSYNLNSFVPDLVSISEDQRKVLLVEIKPKRSLADEEKLIKLLSDFKSETVKALLEHQFFAKENPGLRKILSQCKLEPAISFYSSKALESPRPEIQYFLFSKEADQFLTPATG